MKRMDYADIKATEIADKLELEKHEDIDLPSFTKELPINKRVKEHSETIAIDYNWEATTEPNIKIRSIEFKKEENLAFYKLSVQDGADTVVIQHNNSLYIIRKTTQAIARALLAVHKKISVFVENIVGYFRTLLGNFYVVSKLDKGSWTFDHELADNGVKFISPDVLTEKQKESLCDIVLQKLSVLHSKNLILGKFGLKNILLTDKDGYFTDVRNLRVSKKPSVVVEEFKFVLSYLLSNGLMDKETTYSAIASYCVANENACKAWYKERLGNQAASTDTYDIATAIESEI